jgi:DNA-directed RNA polymerase sigma subunit (sigma70/sigma32)
VRDKEFLKVLDDRERTIIMERFGQSHQTLEKVAETMGLTRQRVHQLQNDALEKFHKAKKDWESRKIK